MCIRNRKWRKVASCGREQLSYWRGDVTVICGQNTISMLLGNTAYCVKTRSKICRIIRIQELSSYSDGRPFDHNRHGPKSGGLLCPFPWEDLGPHLTQCGLDRVLLRTQWHLDLANRLATIQRCRQTGQTGQRPVA